MSIESVRMRAGAGEFFVCHKVCQICALNSGRKGEKENKFHTRAIKKPCKSMTYKAIVPRTGFEPAHLAAPPPEDGASTNFATWAPFDFWSGDANIKQDCI